MSIIKTRILSLIDGSGENDSFLEEAIGLPRGIIYKWRNDKNKNFKFYAIDIAAYFRVSTDYLLGNTDDPTPAGQKESSPQGGEQLITMQNIGGFLDGLDQDQLKQVLDMAMKKFMEGNK